MYKKTSRGALTVFSTNFINLEFVEESCAIEDQGSLKCKVVCQTAKGGEFRCEHGQSAQPFTRTDRIPENPYFTGLSAGFRKRVNKEMWVERASLEFLGEDM